MDEGQFARELAKYRVVRRPEYIGGKQKRDAVEQPTTAAAKPARSKAAATASQTSTGAATKSAAPEDTSFWGQLTQYLSERMPPQDAQKLATACKNLYEAKEQAPVTKAPPAAVEEVN
jgi:hypothetical protein